jgi:glycine cleavage system H protein
MSRIPENLYYTEDHEWIEIEGNVAKIGITDHAQSELGDIVFVEFPELGDSFDEGDSIGTLEAVKTVADLYTPFECEVLEINEALEDDAEIINQDCYGEGWIVKVNVEDLDKSKLLTSLQYKDLIS